MTNAFITFDEDEDYDTEIENVVVVEPTPTGDMILIHAHEQDGCNDYFIPRERIKMIVVRTEYDG